MPADAPVMLKTLACLPVLLSFNLLPGLAFRFPAYYPNHNGHHKITVGRTGSSKLHAFSTHNFFETIASLGLGGVLLLPFSVVIDTGLQKGYKRIDTIANTIIEDNSGFEPVRCYVARPPNTDGRPRPVVLVTHQFFGLRLRDTELCDELARLGYIAVAPDCYQGNTTGVIPRAIWLVRKAAFNNDWDAHLRDFGRVVDWVGRQPDMDSTRVAVSGFCFGGGVSLRYADEHPDKVKAVGVFYGKMLQEITGLSAPVYGVYGTKDRQFPPEKVSEFKSLLDRKGIKNEMRSYEGRAHAFVVDLADIRRGGDSGDAWDGFIRFLERNLGSSVVPQA